MSAPQAAGAATAAVTGAAPYWRSAGLSYVAYANACAVHLRKCLKEPFKTKAADREQVHYKFSQWVEVSHRNPQHDKFQSQRNKLSCQRLESS